MSETDTPYHHTDSDYEENTVKFTVDYSEPKIVSPDPCVKCGHPIATIEFVGQTTKRAANAISRIPFFGGGHMEATCDRW